MWPWRFSKAEVPRARCEGPARLRSTDNAAAALNEWFVRLVTDLRAGLKREQGPWSARAGRTQRPPFRGVKLSTRLEWLKHRQDTEGTSARRAVLKLRGQLEARRGASVGSDLIDEIFLRSSCVPLRIFGCLGVSVAG